MVQAVQAPGYPARASVKESVELSDDMLRCKTLLSPRPNKLLRVVAFKTTAVLAPLCPGPPDPEEAGVGVLEAEVEADPSMEGTGSGADAGVAVAVSDVVAGGAAVPVAGVVVADVVMDEVVIDVAVVEDSPVESPLGEVSLEGASTSWMTTVPDLSAEASRHYHGSPDAHPQTQRSRHSWVHKNESQSLAYHILASTRFTTGLCGKVAALQQQPVIQVTPSCDPTHDHK